MPNTGKLIILNGGSSAGKTSLGKALQEVMTETYLLMGIDLFWFTLPQKQLDLEQVDPEFYSWHVEEREGKALFVIDPGPILDQAMYGRYLAIEQFLKLGMNVVADEVFWKKEWLEQCLTVFEPYDTTFVHVFCRDDIGEKRERERGDRHDGWNRGSAFYASKYAIYDLELDTSDESPLSCAQRLKSLLGQTRSTAALRMREATRL